MITLIFGPDAYARRQALQAVRTKFAQTHGEEGIERYDGDNIQPTQLWELFQGATLFSSAKLVIIREASRNKSLWEALDERLDRVPEETHVVLIESAPDKRTRTFKHLQKIATLINCDELDENKLVNWLVETSSGRLVAGDARYLLQRLGSDRMILANELEKLLASSRPLNRELITELTEANVEGNAFVLLDTIFAGKGKEVEAQLRVLRASEDPYRLFGLVSSQIFTLSVIWAVKDQSIEAAARASGAHPFVVRKLRSVSQTLSRTQLQSLVTVAAELDERLKSSPIDPWELLTHGCVRMALAVA